MRLHEPPPFAPLRLRTRVSTRILSGPVKTPILLSSAAAAVCTAALLSNAPASAQGPGGAVVRAAAVTEPVTVRDSHRPVAGDEARRADAADSGYAAVAANATRAGGLSRDVLALALGAVRCGVASGDLVAPRTLTVIDYSLPSTSQRLWTFDLETGALLFAEHVAHGQRTGENMAVNFSDVLESRQSSIGLFRTDNTYVGRNGYSLRLDGLEPGFNGRARERAIVMHGAPYVDATAAERQGRLGRSWGCPAVRDAIARDLIDTISGGGVVFSYYPDPVWLRTSRFLSCPAIGGPEPPRSVTPGVVALTTPAGGAASARTSRVSASAPSAGRR